MEWNEIQYWTTDTHIHILSLHHIEKNIPYYKRPDMYVFPLKIEGLIWSHNRQKLRWFVSQAWNKQDLQHQGNLILSVKIINMVKTDQCLSAWWVHYHVQALGWVGGCFREKRHHVFRIILASHQVDMQTGWQLTKAAFSAPNSYISQTLIGLLCEGDAPLYPSRLTPTHPPCCGTSKKMK